MLNLSRQVDQRIIIGGGIAIVVKELKRGKVTLGITAPSETRIAREELLSPGEVAAMLAEQPAEITGN